jgi:hypothetical protein
VFNRRTDVVWRIGIAQRFVAGCFHAVASAQQEQKHCCQCGK